jgi:uncharacterized membrane protein
LVGAPAAAQTYYAQECATFGEAQYRRSDPAVEHIVASDFPAPALERFDGKVGIQAIVAAVTLRGRFMFRNRPALESDFVCLLDKAEKPVFFYALPALALRGSPTPLVRGAVPAPAQPPPPPAAPVQPAPIPPTVRAVERPPLPPGAIRLRGLVRDIGGRLQFEPCGGAPLALEDETEGQELVRAYRNLAAGQEGRPMFVEMYGRRDGASGAGISAVELRRAAVETAGCRERFDQREWIVVVGDPPWRLEITSRDMSLSSGGGTPAQRVLHGGLRREGALLVFNASEGVDLRVAIDEQRCTDTASGSLFAYLVEVRSEGRSFVGCAAHNPAMPAP